MVSVKGREFVVGYWRCWDSRLGYKTALTPLLIGKSCFGWRDILALAMIRSDA
jgi:hypothetical protein